MKNLWLRFGCFLTGHNYNIVKNSSEVTAKAVKKYLSAILIVATLWAFVGFAFTKRYLHGDLTISIIGAVVMVLLVIQIERQIILSVGKNNWAVGFRLLIAIVMAILGSVILDQIMFKEDVEKKSIEYTQIEVNRLLPIKTKELTNQIALLDSAINNKEIERNIYIQEVTKKPTISIPSSKRIYEKDTATGDMALNGKEVTYSSVVNPKAELIPEIDLQLKELYKQKNAKEEQKLNIRIDLENELNSRVGFLDELKTLFSILLSSPISLIVWILLFTFFLAIELFVLVGKLGDGENDYDKTVIHQMAIKSSMLDKLKDQKAV